MSSVATKAHYLLMAELANLLEKSVEIAAVRGRFTGILKEVQPNYVVLKTAISRVILMTDQIIYIREKRLATAGNVKNEQAAKPIKPITNTTKPPVILNTQPKTVPGKTGAIKPVKTSKPKLTPTMRRLNTLRRRISRKISR